MIRIATAHRSLDQHLRQSLWLFLLVLTLGVGMVWTKTVQAQRTSSTLAQQEAAQPSWEPSDGNELADVTEDILGVGFYSILAGSILGLAGPWRAHMRNLRVERIYPLVG
jgi:hypothetical protein